MGSSLEPPTIWDEIRSASHRTFGAKALECGIKSDPRKEEFIFVGLAGGWQTFKSYKILKTDRTVTLLSKVHLS